MKRWLMCVPMVLLFVSSPAFGFLDLEQEVLHIPDTHETNNYVRSLRHNPEGYDATINGKAAGGAVEITLGLVLPPGERADDLRIFVTDRKADRFYPAEPVSAGEAGYRFTMSPPRAGSYRFEVLFRTPEGWVRLSRNVKLPAASGGGPEASDPDAGYQVYAKTFPRRVYADHVATFLYEVFYEGTPVTDLEPVGGHDLVVAAWDLGWWGALDTFVFGESRQNLGGPEAAASLVFDEPGRYAVFAQFRHRGRVRVIESTVTVHLEQKPEEIGRDFDSAAGEY